MDGKRFERDLVAELRKLGIRTTRPRQTRAVDVGDLWIEDDVVVQAKAWKSIAAGLKAGTEDAVVQAVHARRPFGVAVIKKPNRPISEAYVAMDLATFARLLQSREAPEQ